MTDITKGKVEAYLFYVAENPPSEDWSNEDFILSIAIAYREGFITSIDWDSEIGKRVTEYVSLIWPEFEEWLNEFEPGALAEIALLEDL
jgi:hypothetical protein